MVRWSSLAFTVSTKLADPGARVIRALGGAGSFGHTDVEAVGSSGLPYDATTKTPSAVRKLACCASASVPSLSPHRDSDMFTTLMLNLAAFTPTQSTALVGVFLITRGCASRRGW